MFSHNISPIIFKSGNIQVTYYALVYLIGFLLVLFLFLKYSKEERINIKENQAYDLTILLVLGTLVGARIFHILFWNFSYFSSNPDKILRIWEGGLSFHGGLVGIFLATWFYCKHKKINFWKIVDLLALLGILMGVLLRIANFINQEIVGTITNASWCFNFKYNEGCRHPVQLYAAAGRLIFFSLLLGIKQKLKNYKPGFIFLISIFGLGLGRFFLDFIREDVIHFGLKTGQWFSLAMIVISLPILINYYRPDLKRIFE
ncbi:MAG: prolipoprotein diacylglyceryl transferase [Nanoarchaeota archaeon]